MTPREQRCLFTLYVARLLLKANEMGFHVAIGEVTRDARVALLNSQSGAGISNSLHVQGLAVDLNLYDSTGRWLSKSEDHTSLGMYWKSLDPNNRWGGDFRSRPDGNHYSYSPDGVRA
jgi:D-alanyl-D-alanine carboxypeptidase